MVPLIFLSPNTAGEHCGEQRSGGPAPVSGFFRRLEFTRQPESTYPRKWSFSLPPMSRSAPELDPGRQLILSQFPADFP